jgi:outer membrane protein
MQRPESRFDVFVAYRFEGFPYDRVPASLAGMANREAGVDLGLGYQGPHSVGNPVRRSAAPMPRGGSGGSEIRGGYRYDWKLGKLQLQPQLTFAARDARLNNYYYGVRPSEATGDAPGLRTRRRGQY